MTKMHPSLSIRLLLVFALLFSQLGGLAHGIAHALENQPQDQSQPHDRLCDLCATYAQLGSALGSHAIRFISVEQHAIFASIPSVSFRLSAFAAFSARAPPRHV